MSEPIALNDHLSLSRIVYGMWRVGDDVDTSPRHIQNKITACLDQGITSIDQADIYGGYEAEELLGHALAGSDLRNRIEIITKCDIVAPVGRYSNARIKYYDTSRAHIVASVEHSLRLMQTEHIDLLLVHRPDPLMDHHETGAALDEVIQSGKVRAVGVSNFKPYDVDLLQSAMQNRLVTNQIEISVVAHEAFTNGDIAYAQQHAMPLMAWSPLAGGALFEDTDLKRTLSEIAARLETDVASLAVAWLLAHPAQIIPVMGTNNLARIRDFHKASALKLDRETWFEIYTTALGQEVA